MQDPLEHHDSSQSTASSTTAPLSNSPADNLGLVEVRAAGAMGSGLFAVKDIPRGTRIVQETPILALPTSSEGYGDVPAFCTELQLMTAAEKKTLDELCYNDLHINPEVRGKVRGWYREQGVTDTDGSPLKGKRLQDVSKATVKRFAIFLTNSVQMGIRGVYGCGLFALFSRSNHSCIPNAYNAYNATIKRLTIHAIHDLQAGEQIMVSYIDCACRTKKQRRTMLEAWGFSCGCAACTDSSAEDPRLRLQKLDQHLAMYGNLQPSGLIAKLYARFAPTNAAEALRDAHELADLLKEQGLEGMDLCHA